MADIVAAVHFIVRKNQVFEKRCHQCKNNFNLEDVKVDLSSSPDCCYCPHCGCALKNIDPDSVDFAKHFKFPQMITFVGVFVICGFAIMADVLLYASSIMLFVFGAWLQKSTIKDHVIIGWILMLCSIVLIGFPFYFN